MTISIVANRSLRRIRAVTAPVGSTLEVEDAHADEEVCRSSRCEAAGFVSVGAVGPHENGLKIAGFSNTGCNFVGPGVGVMSANAGTTDGLVAFSGTSMATPHAAGIAALWLQRISNLPAPDGFFPPGGSRGLGRLLGTATHRALGPGFDPVDVGNRLVRAP